MKKSTKLSIVFLVLSAVIIFAGFNLSDLNSSQRERYDQAKSSGNTATGTITEAREDTERSGGKRQRTNTVYCPVYTYMVGEDREYTFTDKLNCEDSEDAVAIGATAPIIFENAGTSEFADTQGTQDKLAAKQGGNTFLLVIGWIVFGISALVLIGSLVRRKPTQEQHTPNQHPGV